MIDIGPNLLAAVLALVSLGTAVVAAWRAERAVARSLATQSQADANTARIANIEQTNGK